ncbi:MAG: NAD-dependent epimerase/dehydratase family protein [Blastocatellia bacterium]
MRELVLGGAGLIGTELVGQLRQAGHLVKSIDLRTGEDLRVIDLDPCLREVDRVWFLAWDTGGAKYLTLQERQHQMYLNNCQLSTRVFDALSRTKIPFLFVTSQLAGQPTAYGQTKWMAEGWARQLGGRIARLWNIYGWESPDERSHVVTDFVLTGLTQGKVRMMTTGEERRRFLYKSDGVERLVRFFDGGETAIDIAGRHWVRIAEMAEEVARQLSCEVERGELVGEEVMVDPTPVIDEPLPELSLSEGVARVIQEAMEYLRQHRGLLT